MRTEPHPIALFLLVLALSPFILAVAAAVLIAYCVGALLAAICWIAGIE